MEYTTVMINGQPYHIVGRTQDELVAEAVRMREERTVTLPELKFEITDAYAEWFLAAEEERRTRGYHFQAGNIPGAPGVAIYRQAFQAGKSPTEANDLYIQAEQQFLQRESALDCGILPTESQPAAFDTSEPY